MKDSVEFTISTTVSHLQASLAYQRKAFENLREQHSVHLL